MPKYVADGEVYNVREGLEENVEGDYSHVDPDWFEYRAWLIKDGKIVAEFDSCLECYNGVQKLTESEAQAALDNILDDINNIGVNPHNWFTF